MKDIYNYMNTQNILKYYGSKLDLKLDSSEFYDFELGKNELDYDYLVLDFETPIIYTSLKINSECLDENLNDIKPWEIIIDQNYSGYTCDFNIRKRTERGWTLDFVFNRDSLDWSFGKTFYYWGIKEETEPKNYLDNNLSFSFTEDGRIKWLAYRYSGYCMTNSGYTETSYISSGQTGVLCSGGTSDDFNITITFKRNNTWIDCDIPNQGGWNDLITGWTVENPLDVLTGATEEFQIIEVLNNKWNKERKSRLGELKIYLNGRKIYKLKDWEEIIPSKRNSENDIVQIWGGGTSGIDNLHTGNTEFNLKRVKYFEEPLNFPNIKHHYKTVTKPFYNINECNEICVDTVTAYFEKALTTEISEVLLTEDNYVLIY